MQERLTQSTALVVPTRASVSQISRAWTDVNRSYPTPLAPLGPGATFTTSGNDWTYGFHVGAQTGHTKLSHGNAPSF